MKQQLSITITKTVQVSHDEWRTHPVTLALTDETTVLDIRSWASKVYNLQLDKVSLNGAVLGTLNTVETFGSIKE